RTNGVLSTQVLQLREQLRNKERYATDSKSYYASATSGSTNSPPRAFECEFVSRFGGIPRSAMPVSKGGPKPKLAFVFSMRLAEQCRGPPRTAISRRQYSSSVYLAQSGHPGAINQCPLLGVKRT